LRKGERYSIECFSIDHAYCVTKHLGCICQDGYETIMEANILDELRPYEVEDYFGVDFLSIHHQLVIYDHINCHNNYESNCLCPSCVPTFYKIENHGFATHRLGLTVLTKKDMEVFIETIMTNTVNRMVNSEMEGIKKGINKYLN